MKRLFLAVMLVLFCMFCSSCNTRSPVHTIDSLESAATSESVHMETENTADSAKLTVESTTEYTAESTEKIFSESTDSTTEPVTSGANWSLTELPDSDNLLHTTEVLFKKTLKWCENYNFYSNPNLVAIVSAEVPQNTIIDRGSLKYGEQIIDLVYIYELADNEPIDTIIQKGIIPASVPYYREKELFTDGEKYYIQLFTGTYDSMYRCLVRISENYVLHFEVEGTDLDFTAIDLICDTASVVEISPMLESQEPLKIDEPLKPVILKNLTWMEEPDYIPMIREPHIGGIVLSDMPEDTILQISLPVSWTEFLGDDPFDRHLYAEFDLRIAGASPERCMYQGFCGEFIYNTVYNTGRYKDEPFVCFAEDTPGVEEGMTGTGNSYWLRRTESPTYHAIEYDCYVQVSDVYIYRFELCLDVDNADLVYDIMDSIQFSIGDE